MYLKLEDFLADLELIWSNCKLFNVIGSQIYRCATTMENLSSGLQRKFKFDQYLTDDQNAEMKEMLDDFDHGNKNHAREDGDDSDEFGLYDPTKHVGFDEKIKFSE